MKHQHINELRTAINAVRSLAALSPAWSGSTMQAGDTIHKNDVQDLRDRLNDALIVLGIQTSAYADTPLAGAPNGTLIRAVHIRELRERTTSGASAGGGGTTGGFQYVLSDLQGSTRAVMNNNGVGTSTVVARHDFLPFGEEIGSGTGLRTSGQGYGAVNTNRWKYGLIERDSTGLDHTWFRKYENSSGRWTSPDPIRGNVRNPQNLNRYSYVRNDPVNGVDPSGLMMCMIDGLTYPCSTAFNVVRGGAGVRAPLETTRWNPDANLGKGGWEYFTAYANDVGWFNMEGVTIYINAYIGSEHVGYKSYYESFKPTAIEQHLFGTKDEWPPRRFGRNFGWGDKQPSPAKPIPELRNPTLDNAKNRVGARPNLQDELNKVKPQTTEPKGWRGFIKGLGQFLEIFGRGGCFVPPIIWTPEIECEVLGNCKYGPIS